MLFLGVQTASLAQAELGSSFDTLYVLAHSHICGVDNCVLQRRCGSVSIVNSWLTAG